MEELKNVLILVARICIGSLFLWAAWEKITHWSGTVLYMRERNLPQVSLFLPAVIVVQVLGGLGIIAGYQTRVAAVVLILFLLPAMVIFHNFWNFSGKERNIEKTLFMKDVAVLGGLLLLVVCGGGTISVNG